jgi:hypothetical protein
VTIFSGRALEDELGKIQTVLANGNAEWKLRMEVIIPDLAVHLVLYYIVSRTVLLSYSRTVLA